MTDEQIRYGEIIEAHEKFLRRQKMFPNFNLEKECVVGDVLPNGEIVKEVTIFTVYTTDPADTSDWPDRIYTVHLGFRNARERQLINSGKRWQNCVDDEA